MKTFYEFMSNLNNIGDSDNFDLNTWFKTTPKEGHKYPLLFCKDNLHMSVQVGADYYCEPRKNNASYYTKVEIGGISSPESDLMPYRESMTDNDSEAIYAYVPIEIVEKIIKKHGGPK
jgi:hypothetical protein